MANYLGSLAVFFVLVTFLPYLVLGYPKHGSKFEKIVYGSEAVPGSIPYQALLNIKIPNYPEGFMLCGGSIIGSRIILTAAHCFKNTTNAREEVKVFLGVHNQGEAFIDYEAESVILHKDFKGKTDGFKNDIALIILKEEIQWSENIKHIEMASNTKNLVGKTAVISGWGDTETGKPSDFLKRDEETIISNEECSETYSWISNGQLCTFDRYQSFCQGDSGGPVVVNNILVGIVSFTYINGCMGYPRGSTRVSYYQNWISEAIENYGNSHSNVDNCSGEGSIFIF